MWPLNWSVIISGIALIVSVLSPMLTSIINNRHQDKIWTREHDAQHKLEVIDNYVRCTGTVLKKATSDTLSAYGNGFGEIFFYTPKSVWALIEDIDKAITSRSITPETQDKFSELCKQLSTCAKRI